MGEKPTEPQILALLWCPDDRFRHWGGGAPSTPSMAAMKACLRRGWIERVGHPDMNLYRRLPAGRAALKDESHG